MNIFNETKKRLKLSNSELADYFGVSLNTMNKWRNGSRQPSDSAIYSLTLLELIEQFAPHLHQKLIKNVKKNNESERIYYY